MEIGIRLIVLVMMSKKNRYCCNRDLRHLPMKIDCKAKIECLAHSSNSNTSAPVIMMNGSRWNTKTLKIKEIIRAEDRCSLSRIRKMRLCLEQLAKKMIRPTWLANLLIFRITSKVVKNHWIYIHPKTPQSNIPANRTRSSNSSSPSQLEPLNKRLTILSMYSLRLFHLEEVDSLVAYPRTSITTQI